MPIGSANARTTAAHTDHSDGRRVESESPDVAIVTVEQRIVLEGSVRATRGEGARQRQDGYLM